MNKAQAIAAAKTAGLKVTVAKPFAPVTNSTRCATPLEFNVGTCRVHHDGDGGKYCWKVDGERRGYVGEAIVWATANQK